MSAIVELGSKQYTVSEGDRIQVEKLDAPAGDSVKIEKVMALLGGDDPQFGRPYLEGASVEAKVVRHGRGPKITVFKYKPKKRIRTTTGHRQDFTELEIDKIISS